MNFSEIQEIAIAVAAKKKAPQLLDLPGSQPALEADVTLDSCSAGKNTCNSRHVSNKTIVIDL